MIKGQYVQETAILVNWPGYHRYTDGSLNAYSKYEEFQNAWDDWDKDRIPHRIDRTKLTSKRKFSTKLVNFEVKRCGRIDAILTGHLLRLKQWSMECVYPFWSKDKQAVQTTMLPKKLPQIEVFARFLGSWCQLQSNQLHLCISREVVWLMVGKCVNFCRQSI